MKINLQITKRAFSLIEIIVALGIFGTVAISVAFFAIDTARFTSSTEKNILSSLKYREIYNVININKNDIWSNIVNNTDNGSKRLVLAENNYSIVDGEVEEDGILINIYINSISRNSELEIVQDGGFLDPETREVQVDMSWIDTITGYSTVSYSFYINNWNTPRLEQTTETDFEGGTNNQTIITGTGDGAVEIDIDSRVNGNWCEPSLTVSTFDLPGNGVANTITAIEGRVALGTGENASGVSYIDVKVNKQNPPQITVNGTFDGYKTNDVFGEEDFGYIATDTNSSEVLILDITGSGTNPILSGYYDAPGNTDADSVYVEGNYGYTTTGNTLYIFDLSSKIGSRPMIGSAITLEGIATDLVVMNGYAYLAIDNSTTQIQIVDVSTPASSSVVGNVQANALGAVGLFIDDTTDRLYFVSKTSTTNNEFFIVDISSKTGTQTIVSSYNISDNMNPIGVTVPESSIAIVVGQNGAEQYQVLDIETETSITKCGGLAIPAGIRGVDSILDSRGDAWSYITTGDSSAELQIIEGGPGGGGGNGQGENYYDSGEFISSVLDSGSATTKYYSIGWIEDIFLDTSIQVQLRVGDTSNLNSENWFGPDGTSSTFFTNSSGEVIPPLASNHRYIQYKVNLTSLDKIFTPVFEEIHIYYE